MWYLVAGLVLLILIHGGAWIFNHSTQARFYVTFTFLLCCELVAHFWKWLFKIPSMAATIIGLVATIVLHIMGVW